MIQSDRGVYGIIDLNDLPDVAAAARDAAASAAQFDLVVPRLLPLRRSTPGAAGVLHHAGGLPSVQRTVAPRIQRTPRCTLADRPGCQTARLEADLQRLVDELAAEVQRLDENLESLLGAAAIG